jgi:hypothetical protein
MLGSARIQDHFVELTDPRRRRVTYPLINIVTIAVCAVICGADDFVSIAEFGRKKRKWLTQFLDLTSGIPSHDRFNAVLGAIKPAEFDAYLLNWNTALHEITAIPKLLEILAISGCLVTIDRLATNAERIDARSIGWRSTAQRRPGVGRRWGLTGLLPEEKVGVVDEGIEGDVVQRAMTDRRVEKRFGENVG